MGNEATTKQGKRGATGVAYGLVVGLIAIVALGAITNIGAEVDGLFNTVGDELDGVVTEANNSVPGPTPTPSAAALADTAITTSGSGINITGGTSPGACRDFTVENSSGSATTGPLNWEITLGSSNFQAGSCTDTCTGNMLGPGATCSFGVQPIASANGSYTGEVTLYMHSGAYLVDFEALDGTASGFVPGQVAYPPQCSDVTISLTNGSCGNLSDGFQFTGTDMQWMGVTWDDNCTSAADANLICMLILYGNTHPQYNTLIHPVNSSASYGSPSRSGTFWRCPSSQLSFTNPLANNTDFAVSHVVGDVTMNTLTCRWNSY